MMINNNCTGLLICPVCAAPLTQVGAALRCQHRHSFDIARQGYVNLLLANRQTANLPGDTKDMLLARRAFLERGHFAPLSNTVNRAVYDYLARQPGREIINGAILDAGCGEGYYLGRLMGRLSDRL